MQRKFNGQNNSRVTNKQTNKHGNTDVFLGQGNRTTCHHPSHAGASYNYTNHLRPKASRPSQFKSVPFSLYICPNWHVIFPFACRFIMNVLPIVVQILWNHKAEEKYLRHSKHVGFNHSYLRRTIFKNRVNELSCIFPDYAFFGEKQKQKKTQLMQTTTELRRSPKCYNPHPRPVNLFHF